ncbi:SIS domain-containing protein [bacterium]|nr:SIS domain-containing protein [bacterium]
MIESMIRQSIAVKEHFLADEACMAGLRQCIELAIVALKQGGTLFFAGNGGSYTDCQHIVGEFVGRLITERPPLSAVALGMNGASLTAIGNDYGYEQVFARELQALGRSGDVFFPLSTSGNSRNLLAAIPVAQTAGMSVVGWTGATGGKMAELVPCIKVPSGCTMRIQECHIMMGHLLCAAIDRALHP